ncbi:MAG TPA: hypothetical protein VG328_04025 [Stellaceae bacterium]|nr:hypothetical protein [Stellaceae bacterium]
MADFPLLKVVRMPEEIFARLEGTALIYIWHSLCRAHPHRHFTLSPNVLREHVDEILTLPNRTPNGVLLPRRDTFHAFNMIHQALTNVLDAAGMLKSFASLQIPCNVRIVSGAPDPEADARSYASAKMHTDVWNGEPVSSILFNIPVLGDPKAVDLRFYEPRSFPEELRVGLRDYELGRGVTDSAVEYPAKFEMGHIYVSDALSLHRTLRVQPTLRVSLDFRAISRELLAGESADHSTSRAVYVAPEAWQAAGLTTILASGDPLDAFQRRAKGEAVAREALSVVAIDDMSEG